MKLFIDYIKGLSDNDLEFYSALVGLLLSTIAAVLLYNWREIKIIYFLSCILLFCVGLIIVYAIHFRHVKPFMFSMLLSTIVTLITGIIVVMYLKFFKDNTGFSMPVAYVSQLVIANLIKHLLKLN